MITERLERVTAGLARSFAAVGPHMKGEATLTHEGGVYRLTVDGYEITSWYGVTEWELHDALMDIRRTIDALNVIQNR